MRMWVLALALLAFGGCAPQTRAEFVAMAKAGTHSQLVYEQFEVHRSLGAVVENLRKRSSACLDKISRHWYHDGEYGRTHVTQYVPRLVRPKRGRAAFTLRVMVKSMTLLIGEPDGGIYVAAADLRARGGRTVVDFSALTGEYEEIADALRSWLHGDRADCPELP